MNIARPLIDTVTSASERLVLGGMLLLLHFALWSTFASPVSRSLVIAHLGLFLLWQPIWGPQQRIAPGALLAFAALVVAAVTWMSWALVFGWLVLLIGIVGGRDLRAGNARFAYLIVLVFLVSELLIKCVPELFGLAVVDVAVNRGFGIGLAALPLVIACLRYDIERGAIDLFRGISVALIVAILALGSLLNMYHREVDYPVALAQSLLGLAAFLLLISWLVSPQRGLTGFAQLWERSLLSIGTPFERWIAELATFAERETTAQAFLRAAMAALVKLPWVEGVSWRAVDGDGRIGAPTRFEIRMQLADLDARVYTRRAPGPTLFLHCQLLLQLLAQFHQAKVRERELAQQAQLQAVYETGARVTHDIKNLLQSLQTIMATLVMERENDGSAQGASRSRAQQLFERQLPHIASRLQAALDKLQTPQRAAATLGSATEWWRLLREHSDQRQIAFVDAVEVDRQIPIELFDSVIENLLDNARAKQALDPAVRVQVRLGATADAIELDVTDTGAPVPTPKADELGRHPVASDTGLGIGLYQASRQAELLGYQLTLVANEPGHVQFRLTLMGTGDTEVQRVLPLAAPVSADVAVATADARR